jgi:hypothetical protein
MTLTISSGQVDKCCNQPTKKTMYGNFRCLACKRIYEPGGRVIFKPRNKGPA